MRERLPSLPSVPRVRLRLLQGLLSASVRSDGVSCDGTLDALNQSGQAGSTVQDGSVCNGSVYNPLTHRFFVERVS
jgi:hypothetical protein